MPSIIDIWNQKEHWFRDYEQDERVCSILVHRLADDRIQEECRYLMRLRWHFHMGYQEVSYEELHRFVSEIKMARLNELFSAIAVRDYEAIDSWIDRCERELPIIKDKWIEANPDLAPLD